MPPRTGPRRRRRPKQAAPPPALRLAVIRTDETIDLVLAYRLELDDGNLVLRDGADAIIQIIASGEWREIRPASPADIPFPEETDNADSEAPDYLTPPDNRPAEETDEVAREQAIIRGPFVPSSPEEAQRILMELERRLAPESDPDHAPPAPPRKD